MPEDAEENEEKSLLEEWLDEADETEEIDVEPEYLSTEWYNRYFGF